MYGFEQDGHAHCEGLNSRLDELQAAILLVKLNTLESRIELRRRRAAVYHTGLQNHPCITPQEDTTVRHAYHLYVIRSGQRSQLTQRLDQAEIGWGIHYPLPVHLMEAYQFLGYQRGDLPVTEEIADEILSLPIFPELENEKILQIIDVLCNET